MTKIFDKQIKMLHNLEGAISKFDSLRIEEDEEFMEFIKSFLQLNPQK